MLPLWHVAQVPAVTPVSVVPLIVHVLEQFLVKGVLTQIRLNSLLDFTYNLALACGILMQLPLVTMLLTAIGLVQPMFLLKQWRYAIVVSFIVAAIVTPTPDPFNQLLVAVPVMLLFEFGALLARFA